MVRFLTRVASFQCEMGTLPAGRSSGNAQEKQDRRSTLLRETPVVAM